MTLPRLTVITPSLNQGAFLGRALRSVLDQGYPQLEHVVVDGGSTDGSVEILERFSDRLSWWVSEPDRGQTHALNKGLARATGEIVGYLNSDDYLLEGALEAVGRMFADPSVEWVVGSCRFLHDDGRVETVWRPARPTGPRLRWLLEPWSVPQPSSFWRRSVLERAGGFREDLHYVFDTELMLRLALGGVFPVVVERELAVRFLHGAAKSADRRFFEAERRQMVQALLPRLTWQERALLRLGYRRWGEPARRLVWRARGRRT